jgi:hypothetical protein
MKIKRKGVFEYELDWHQNFSALVIPKAVESFFIGETDIESFIINHNDYYDFFMRTKVPRSSQLFWGGQRIQNVTRYYISNEGESLLKIMPPIPKKGYRYILDDDIKIVTTKADIAKLEKKKYTLMGETEVLNERHISINAGWKTKICNDIRKFDKDINFAYYIEEAKKMIRGFNNQQECTE